MNTISLFSGATGLDLGFKKAGFDIKLCIEMDKWACKTIRKNTNIPLIEGDINDITTEQILEEAKLKKEEVDIIIGGPPCQAFSSAGKMKGLEDFRGNVIVKYLEIIKSIKPKFFILENVRGLLSAKLNAIPSQYTGYDKIVSVKGSVMYFLIKEFAKYDYTLSFALYNSANYGAPQKRDRIIIMGHRGKERIPLPSPTHSENAKAGTKKWLTLQSAIKDLDEKSQTGMNFSEKTLKYLSLLKAGECWRQLPSDIQEEALGGAYHLSGGKTGFYRRLDMNKPSPTLVTSPIMKATMLAHPEKLRPLSIQEYARIQQFPDNWIFEGSISEIYRQIGNAVPISLGYMAGKQIKLFLKNANVLKEEEERNQVSYSRYKNTTDKEFLENFYKECQKLNIRIDNEQ